MATSPAFLRGGFRPFFFGAGVWALVAVGIWLHALAMGSSTIGAMEALAWHRHEMMFGFVGATISGFLLTAVPNWTGRLPIAGMPLAALFLWWVAGRAVPLVWPGGPQFVIALADAGFYFGLAAIMAREVVLAGNRNLPIVGMVALFGLADFADHATATGMVADPAIAIRAATMLVMTMVSLIGGRIIPSFTRNYLQKRGASGPLPAQPSPFDLAVIALMFGALGGWVLWPDNRWVGVMSVAAALAQFARLWRWQGYRCVADALVLILHLAYFWVPGSLALLGMSILGAVPLSAAIHALTAGAMTMMILAVVTRATLGHTGRELKADDWTKGIYALAMMAAFARVAASLGIGDYTELLHWAGGLWMAAFGLFLLSYGPKLLGPRADGKL